MPTLPARMICTLLALATPLAQAQPAQDGATPYAPLEYGVWKGELTQRDIPDPEGEGEWQDQVQLSHCPMGTWIQYIRDGRWGRPVQMELVPFDRMHLLVYLDRRPEGKDRWVESQVWTLVDVSPTERTLVQSRAVINPETPRALPWHTFRRLAWGTLRPADAACPPVPEQPPPDPFPKTAG